MMQHKVEICYCAFRSDLFFELFVNLFVLRTENKNTNKHTHYQQSFIVCEYSVVLKC
jgi:hypothetical protein